MDKKIAKEINNVMLNLGDQLNNSVQMVMENCSEQEFKNYRGSVGKIMGEMLLEIMNPIYKEHPDLKPKELGGINNE